MSLFDPIVALVELCFTSVRGLLAVVLGLLAAVVVWNVGGLQYRAPLAAITYVLVFALCLVFGQKSDLRK